MPLPVSGPISFNNINVELGVAGTTQASLNQTSYRTLAGVPSGTISMSNFYGKANEFPFTISSNQTNPDLRTLALAAGWNSVSKVVATIAPGIYCGSNSTGIPGLTISGAFPGGVNLVNNGIIVGMGGRGGNGSTGNGGAGLGAGLALSVQVAVTITNNGTIAGGGGGGGGGGGSVGGKNDVPISGTGGGGGRSSQAANSPGGSGGLQGGPPGTVSAAGSNGGNWGTTGGRGANGNRTSFVGGVGGAGGGAVSGNSNITWLAFGTRLGAIT